MGSDVGGAGLEAANQLIFFGALLVATSILAGLFSSRLGVPLLLVFLGIGMLVGEDGPGGIPFDDYATTYLVGSIALAVILFDGGLHTSRSVFQLALWPAISLATVGVLVSTAVVGAIAILVMGASTLEGLLLGAVLASTDAAAVFLLLHAHGLEINRRVSATLETESGINDPMAVFLVLFLVRMLQNPGQSLTWFAVEEFLVQMLGGAAIGIGGGFALTWIVNRIEIATGLYAILVAAAAIAIFSGANAIGASGFLAVYLAGIVLGNRPHRAQHVISRFHDGLAWLAQIVMFLLLGLLVTPSHLVKGLVGSIVIAVALMLAARPLAVWISLLPFRFNWREQSFIAWMGLRGAVPIFLASIPILAGLPQGHIYFEVTFVAVLASLLIQGWTVGPVARWLGLEVPAQPDTRERRELDLPGVVDRELTGYRVTQGCGATRVPFADLVLPRHARVVAVMREGSVLDQQAVTTLVPEDYVVVMAPPEQLLALDKLFAPPLDLGRREAAGLGEFVLHGNAPMSMLAELYGLPVDAADQMLTLAQYMRRQLRDTVVIGDRMRLGSVDLVVRELDDSIITGVGLELDPQEERLPVLRAWRRLRTLTGQLGARIRALVGGGGGARP